MLKSSNIPILIIIFLLIIIIYSILQKYYLLKKNIEKFDETENALREQVGVSTSEDEFDSYNGITNPYHQGQSVRYSLKDF